LTSHLALLAPHAQLTGGLTSSHSSNQPVRAVKDTIVRYMLTADPSEPWNNHVCEANCRRRRTARVVQHLRLREKTGSKVCTARPPAGRRVADPLVVRPRVKLGKILVDSMSLAKNLPKLRDGM
jgi:hypothetical protein